MLPRVTSALRWWPAPVSLGYGIVLTLLRGRPTLDVDAGVFLSVAARLLHGDRLYTQVWDNKDPLFFYTDAAALWIGGWRGPFLLDALWLAVAALSVLLLLRRLGHSVETQAVAFVAYPLLLTGQWYYAGYSMLAALALAPAAAWLWARGNAGAAGAVVTAAALFKINLVLVLVAGPLALLAAGLPDRRRARHLLHGLGGLVAVGALATAALAALGELGAYLDTLRENASYASRVLVANGRPRGIHGHIRVAETATAHARPLIVVFALACLLAGWMAVRSRSAVAMVFLLTTVAAAVTLAATAAWNHHVQMAAYPGALLAAFLVSRLRRLRPALRVAARAGVAGALVWALGGAGGHGWSVSTWFDRVTSKTAVALAQARASTLPAARTVTYAHLGQNDEEGHAAFLHGDWKLACARFHQYPWSSRASFDEVVTCLRQKRPELVLVTSSLSLRPGAPAAWDAFIRDSTAVVRTGYRRVYFLRHPHGTIAVWKLRSTPS
jgi:hypothetical protein